MQYNTNYCVESVRFEGQRIFLVMAVYEVFFIGHRIQENVKYGLEVVSEHGQRINNIVAQNRAPLLVKLRTSLVLLKTERSFLLSFLERNLQSV